MTKTLGNGAARVNFFEVMELHAQEMFFKVMELHVQKLRVQLQTFLQLNLAVHPWLRIPG